MYLGFETSLNTSKDNHNDKSKWVTPLHITQKCEVQNVGVLKAFLYPEMSGNYFLLFVSMMKNILKMWIYIFVFNTALNLPRIDSYNFWKVSNLFVRTSASCFRDPHHSLQNCPKYSGLIIFRSGDLPCSNWPGLLIMYDLHAHAHIMRFAIGK